MPPRKRLGQLLTELGVIDEHQLQSALGHQKQWGGKLGAILVQKGFCNEDQMVSALTQHLGLPRVKLAETKIDPRAQKCVSRQIAEKLHVFPYELTGAGRSEVVTIAMSDPTDLSAVDQLAFHTGKRIKPMLAGDSEVLNAIHAHYGAPDEKKEPTGKVAQQQAAASPAAAPPPRSVESAPAVPPRPSPYIPPPIPPASQPSRAEELDEIEPDEVMAPPTDTAPAKPSPVEVPEADAEGMGLEPIAAHSQFGDEVSGQEEVSGHGSASDEMEGFVAAGTSSERAQDAAWPHEEEAAPGTAWEAAPQPEPDGWAEASDDVPVDDVGWGTEPEAQPADVVGEELPHDAILGAPAGTEHRPAEEPEPADFDAPLPIEDAIDPAEDLAGGPAAEEAPIEVDEEPGEAPVDETAAAGSDAEAAAQEAAPEQVAYEAEAPDAWASSDDPLAAQGGDAPAWAEVPGEESADHASGEGATQEFANPVEQEGAALDRSGDAAEEATPEDAAGGWGGEEVPVEEARVDELQQEEPPAEEPQPEELQAQEPQQEELQAEEPQPEERPEEEPQQEELQAEEPQPEAAGEYAENQGEEAGLQLENWVAPPEEPEPQGAGWIGEALEAAPLAPADLDVLASIGLDPNDGVGALRLLASLIRILQRRQLIDAEELASEIRESRAQGAVSAAEQYEAEAAAADADAPADPGSAET